MAHGATHSAVGGARRSDFGVSPLRSAVKPPCFSVLALHRGAQRFRRNAVRMPILLAIAAYCMIAIAGGELKIDRSPYEMLPLVGALLRYNILLISYL